MPTVSALLSTLCAVAAGLYLVGWLIAGAVRLTYPYPLDGMEDAAVQMLHRVAQGVPLYGAPSLEVVPLLYGPLYFELSALVAEFTGGGPLPLRLVSLLASCVRYLGRVRAQPMKGQRRLGSD
jgi:hypothetical protein